MPTHFGVIVGKKGLKLTRDKYAISSKKSSFDIKFKSIDYEDDKGRTYTDEWCQKHQKDVLANFDLSMEYFSLLDHEEFVKEIISFIKKNRYFKEVKDLNQHEEKPGYYVMVLDEYCQLYVGTAKDIQKRVRQHWIASKPFDRLLLPIGAIGMIKKRDIKNE